MINPSFMIVVPLEEPGWVTVSSPEAVKARLAAPRSPEKSEEELREQQLAQEEKHALLHQLHVESIKQRAQRENERAAETRRRRLRQEATEKQRLLASLEAEEKRASVKKEAIEAEVEAKRARREALKEAFFSTRASMAHDVHARALVRLTAQQQAEAKRTKLLQATVHKSAWEVKHAIAVATAAKEKDQAAHTFAKDCLQERLAAAESRRLQIKASPTSPTGLPAERFGRPGRARQVAQCLNDEAVALQTKRQRLSKAMETALARRAERIDARVHRAAAHKEKALHAFEARQAASEAVEAKHQQVEKEQAAAVRAQLALRKRAGRKPGSFAFDIAFEKVNANAKPAAALLARLNAKPTTNAAAAAERHERASTRAVALLVGKALKTLQSTDRRSKAAAAHRALMIRIRRAKMAAKEIASASTSATMRTERLATVVLMNKRVKVAGAKRAAARRAQLGRLASLAGRGAAVDKKRLSRLATKPSHEARALLFTSARAAQDRAARDRGELQAKRAATAADRRSHSLSATVAKAKMSAVSRATAVKLIIVASPDSGMALVQFRVLQANESLPPAPAAAPEAPEPVSVVEGVVEEAAVELKASDTQEASDAAAPSLAKTIAQQILSLLPIAGGTWAWPRRTLRSSRTSLGDGMDPMEAW